jgi:hypothetical protein
MRFTTTNYLKTTLFAFALLLFAFAGSGCERENLLASDQQPALQGLGSNGVQRPATQCAPSAFVPLQSGSTTLGNVEILNSGDELYLIYTLNSYKFLEETRIFVGNAADVPLNADGLIEIEEFPISQVIDAGTNTFTMVVKLDAIPACYDIFVWTRISTRNIFGHVTQMQNAWMTGTIMLDGAYETYCAADCASSNAANQSTE